MKLQRILFFALFIIATKLPAQFIIGWNGGYGTPRELNREIYIYDEKNGSNLSKRMKPVHWNQGPLIGMRLADDQVFAELSYSRKKAKVSADFDSAGTAMTRQMKVYCNTWNFVIGINRDKWAAGFSFDFGRFKGFGRRGTVSGIKDQEWKRLWVVNKTRLAGIAIYRLYITESVFVERSFGLVSVRLYAQLFGMREKLDGLDTWLFGTELNYQDPNTEHFNNYGVSVFFNIGRK